MLRAIRFRTHGILGACGLALWACNGIVGIETLHEEPNPSAGGSAASGGAAGANAAKGGAVNAGTGGKSTSGGGTSTPGGAGGAPSTNGGAPTTNGGTTGLGGSASIEGGAGGAEGGTIGEGGSGGVPTVSGGKAGSGGKASSGGSTSGGSSSGGASSGGASTGGSGGAGTGPVSGTLIDLWGHPLPNVPISIGAATTVTDASGKFTVAGVAATYDVTAVVSPPNRGTYAWIYQGLTRRDPTLQVYRGLANQTADPTLKPTGASDTNTNAFAWGCPDGSYSLTFGAGTAGTTPLGGLSWFGPSQTMGAYHVLAFKQDTNGYPTEYSSYLSAQLTVAANSQVNIPLAFTSTPLTTATIGGTVTSVTTASRTNYLFARFRDNAQIPLAKPSVTAAAFSFLVPQYQGAEFTVAASEGQDDFYGPYAIAHKMVAAGTTNVTLNVPAPPTQLAPANNRSDITGTTQFTWASGTDVVYVMHVESEPYYHGIYIVTTAKSLKLPDVNGGFFLNKNEQHWWQIEVHGDYTSVDQVARPGGFFSSFGRGRTNPDFYRDQDSGYLAVSSALGFGTAP